ncbi:MAG: hypothetical protein U0903_03395 [Planctomycetales bacterium]
MPRQSSNRGQRSPRMPATKFGHLAKKGRQNLPVTRDRMPGKNLPEKSVPAKNLPGKKKGK